MAAIYEGATQIGGVMQQIIRDWLVKFNDLGSDGLIDRKQPGRPSRLPPTGVGDDDVGLIATGHHVHCRQKAGLTANDLGLGIHHPWVGVARRSPADVIGGQADAVPFGHIELPLRQPDQIMAPLNKGRRKVFELPRKVLMDEKKLHVRLIHT